MRSGFYKKLLSGVLSLAMLCSLGLNPVLASTTTVCEHHTHGADCGYTAAAPCAHEHTENCYTKGLSCAHEKGEHDENCGYTTGTPCTFDPADCLECNPKNSGVVAGEITGFAPLEEEIRWQNTGANTLILPETLDATVNGTETQVAVTWQGEEEINRMEGGFYLLTAQLGEGYTVAAELPKITAFLTGSGRMGGLGTQTSPLKISSVALLKEVADLVNLGKLEEKVKQTTVYIELTENLTLTGEWTPIGTQANPFKGIFDGGGKTISGLMINQPLMDYVGLFGYTATGSEIKNLGVVDCKVTGSTAVGGVVGAANGAVTNCYSTGSVTGNNGVGGVVGIADGMVTSCYATDSITSTIGDVGGVVGFASGEVKNCYATGTVTGTSDQVGGVVGRTVGLVSNCAALNPSVSGGGDVGRVVGLFDTGTSSGTGNVAYAGMPGSWGDIGEDKIDGANADLATLDGKFTGEAWTAFDGKTLPALKGVGQQTVERPMHLLPSGTSPFEGGGTSETDPYLISSEAQLRNLAALVNSANTSYNTAFYELTKDLTLTGEWTPIGTVDNPFKGKFNGGGKTISGLTINQSSMDNVGLFGRTDAGSKIEKLGVVDCKVTGKNYVGGVVGTAGGEVKNCYSTGSVEGTQNFVGGVVGFAAGNVTSCYSTGSVKGKFEVGGVVGRVTTTATVSDCYSTGSVNGGANVGGVVGYASGLVSNCAALNPSVSGDAYVGRVVGEFYTTTGTGNIAYSGMTNKDGSTSWGNIGDTGKDGANLSNFSTLDDKFNDTDVWTSFNDRTLPALKGVGQQTVERPFYLYPLNLSYFEGSGTENDPYKISSEAQLRNLAALVNAGTTPYADAGKFYLLTGNLTLTGEWTPIGTISWDKLFKGNFNGDSKTISGLFINQSSGDNIGLFGYTDTDSEIKNLGVVDCKVTGKTSVGGVVGSASGTVTNCYATGSITGTGYVGGVVGSALGAVTDCYATGSVTGSSDYVGGVVGKANGAVTNCYATGSVTGSGDYVGGVVGMIAVAEVKNCVALNPSVTVSGNGNVGRVVGIFGTNNNIVGSGSGNIAYAGMTGATWGDKGEDKKDGADVAVSDISSADWWQGKGFTAANGWVTADDKLPGFGAAVEPPLYLTNLRGDLEGVAIATAPSKTAYKVGETFDKTGMVVKAIYENGTTEVVENYTISPSGALAAGTSSITISYTKGSVTKTTTQGITVTGSDSGGNGGTGGNSGSGGSGGNGGSGGSIGGGSTGGSSTGGSSTSGGTSNDTSPTVTPPDTDKPINAETKVDGTQAKDGKVTIPYKNITDAISAAKRQAGQNGISVTVNIQLSQTANSLTATLSKSALDKLIAEGVKELKITSNLISFSFNLDALKEIQKSVTGNLTIVATKQNVKKLSADAQTAIGRRPIFDLSMQSAGKAITNFGKGMASVWMPYTLQQNEIAGNVQGVYVNAAGKVQWIPGSSYDTGSKAMLFATNHFSTYGVGYKADAPKFTDIADHWAKTSIEFVVSRGLLNGTGTTTFSPNTCMTRGMFVTALGRLAGVDVNSYKTGQFTDVKADAYYAPYVNWAASNGITSGTSTTTFSPDKTITRQELAVFMANYANTMGYNLPKTREAITFADSAKIGSFATDAVKAMQMAGVMNGKNGNKFDPTGTATRAEVAATLHRYVELVIDPATAQGLDVNDSGSAVMYENGKMVKSAKRTAGNTTYSFNANGESALPPTKKASTYTM